MPELAQWWRNAVVYQVYVRSFADANKDGEGDLAGVRSRLPYLSDLGVDAIWLNPFYPSPQLDGGYDISDHRDVDPRFGTLADFDELVADAHDLGIRVIVDVVPNHVSWEHAWFREAMASAPGSPAWSRFHCVRGKGAEGDLPPNDWGSAFGGPAWTRILDTSSAPTPFWYLHLFDDSQPDLNWDSPEVREDLLRTLRFWLDRGVDGLRIDVATGLVKAAGLPSYDDGAPHPHWDRDEVHDIYRSWRALVDGYPGRVLVGEVILGDAERAARYLRPDELHMAFNFSALEAPWDAAAFRSAVTWPLEQNDALGAPTTWVLENHDIARAVSRYSGAPVEAGAERGILSHVPARPLTSDELERGTRRARAALLFFLALPGSLYLYNGQELALPEVVDLPDNARQDPVFARTRGATAGRDGCRIPLPWTPTPPSLGFSPEGSRPPWLPQPPAWADLSVERQQEDPSSMLSLSRTAISLRHGLPGLHDADLRWRDDIAAMLAPDRGDVLVLDRGTALRVVLVLGDAPVPLGTGGVIIASAPVTDAHLPGSSCAWLAIPG